MKILKLFTMALLGVLLGINLTSCSKEEIQPDNGDNKIEHPNGIPSKIPTNTIYYITNDNIIIRFENEDVFGGAKIVSNTYSSTKGYGTIEFASEVTAIEANAIKGKEALTYIALPNSVKSIGHYAFSGCSGLTSMVIPNSVTSIGEMAFYDCSGLTSVTIPNSVTSIGEEAFRGCSGLTSVTIPNSVTSIGNRAFQNCSGLTLVTIPNSVTSIGEKAFLLCSGLTEMKVDANNSKYDSREGCNAIIETSSNTLISGCQTTVIPNSVTSIGEMAFYECSGLSSVTIPNSVTSIGEMAFDGCSGLTSVTIGRGVTSIGWHAFEGCSGLTSVIIGNNVESIGNYAFVYCESLQNVYCYAEKIPTAYLNFNFPHAFYDSNYKNATLHVPSASIDSYKSTSPWSGFGKIVALN